MALLRSGPATFSSFFSESSRSERLTAEEERDMARRIRLLALRQLLLPEPLVPLS